MRVVEINARKFEFDPAEVVVKQGEIVRLKVKSEDVMHGLGIVAFDIDRKLPPNETVTIEFTADKVGTHHFHCSVYCGTGHNDMHGELVVITAPFRSARRGNGVNEDRSPHGSTPRRREVAASQNEPRCGGLPDGQKRSMR